MTKEKHCFKCGNCKDERLCCVDPNNSACIGFIPKKEIILPIEEMLVEKILWAEPGESITFSEKEIVILRDVLYQDMFKNRAGE